MVRSKIITNINHLLCADIRFSLPDIMNDHCWNIGSDQSQPPVLSIFTTYGLRASRMLLFPTFTLDDQSIQNPANFFNSPLIQYITTNYVALSFSPFQGIDVLLNLWVPTSQMLMGKITCFNHTPGTLTLEMNWHVHLSPLAGGSPMRHTQFGMSNVLQGECANLYPVFYLTGEIYPSKSTIPGLTTRQLMSAGSSKQSTWVLASMSTADTSFQQARQLSSKSLETERLKLEMADKRESVQIKGVDPTTAFYLERSRIRVLQLIMPPMANFKFPTFINSRKPDTGFYIRADRIEIHPEWSGQTLQDIWLMAQSLLPGQPEIIMGFVKNSLSLKTIDGRLDHRVGVNGAQTGQLALPILAQIVKDLHYYLNNLPWVEEIYPDLLAGVRNWLEFGPEGNLQVRSPGHPIQFGVQFSGQSEATLAADLWMKLNNKNSLLITTMLIREVSDLIQISQWLGKTNEIEWLENAKSQLVSVMLKHWDEKTSSFDHPDYSLEYQDKHIVNRLYKHNGRFNPRVKLPSPQRVCLRFTGDGYLHAKFSCTLKGCNQDEPIVIVIRPEDMEVFDHIRVYQSNQALTFIETIEISNMPDGFSVEIGVPDFAPIDLTQLCSLYAGVLTPKQVVKMLRSVQISNYLGDDGVSLMPIVPGGKSLRAPAFLVGIIVEGLLHYGKVNLARKVFDHHFFNYWSDNKSDNHRQQRKLAELSLEDLIPIRLFLKIHGVIRFTEHEVILSHFIKRNQDAVTVQYNKIELRLKPFLTEIHTQSGEVIYLNREGPNRVLFD